MRCQSYSFEKTKDTKFTVKQIPHDTKKSEKKTTLRWYKALVIRCARYRLRFFSIFTGEKDFPSDQSKGMFARNEIHLGGIYADSEERKVAGFGDLQSNVLILLVSKDVQRCKSQSRY